MLSKFSIVLSIIFFNLSILNPAFYLPWSGFLSEYFTFLSFIFLLPSFYKNNIKIPKNYSIILIITLIPIIQYNFGLIYYLNTMILSSIYLFSFFLAIIIGYNIPFKYSKFFEYFFGVFLFCGIVSSLISISQWLELRLSSDFFMQPTDRPFANMAQANHLSTFLFLSLISCLYFFEKKIINPKLILIFSIVIIIAITFTKSRMSWIILFFLSTYLFINHKRGIVNFSFKNNIFYILSFILFSISLPYLQKIILQKDTQSIIDRTLSSSNDPRILQWFQAIEAIKKEPLFGYGWNQASFAQFETLKEGFFKQRFDSFHNILLDIIIWCGIPIGLCIIIFFTYNLIKYLIQSKTLNQICSVSFIYIIIIHALLEYPLNYSYFLLPFGLILGYLSFSFKEKTIEVNKFLLPLIFVLSIIFSTYVFKEYSKIPDIMIAAETHEMNNNKNTVKLPYKMFIFDNFEYRAKWISLYPCTKLNKKQIEESKYMVKTYMIYYDLIKYSQVLTYNHHLTEAQEVLNKINYLYNKKLTIDDLSCKF